MEKLDEYERDQDEQLPEPPYRCPDTLGLFAPYR